MLCKIFSCINVIINTYIYFIFNYFRSLAYTPLTVDQSLLQSLNVSYLNLNGIKFEMIEFEAIQSMSNLKYIIYDRFYFCR